MLGGTPWDGSVFLVELVENTDSVKFIDHRSICWSKIEGLYEISLTLTSLSLLMSSLEALDSWIKAEMSHPSNILNTSGSSALMECLRNANGSVRASECKYQSFALELIAAGVDLNIQDSSSNFALYLATRGNLTEVALRLISCINCHLNLVTSDNTTAFMCACILGRKEIALALLNQKRDDQYRKQAPIDVNVINRAGETALINALQNGHTDLAQAILNTRVVDVNVKKRDKKGKRAIDYFVIYCTSESNDTKLLKLLQEREENGDQCCECECSLCVLS